jgi:hypothetical protein
VVVILIGRVLTPARKEVGDPSLWMFNKQ